MIPARVVSNTSPLIFLEKIQSLDLLHRCFQQVFIPEEVQKEWGAKVLPEFISVRSVSVAGKSYVEGAVGRLHQGELEAVELAVEADCKIVLMDDLLARRFAESKGLIPLGVLGILKLAYELDLLTISEVKDKVSELTTKYGLFVSPDILQQYLDSF